MPLCRNLRMMITILHTSEQRKGKGAPYNPCSSSPNGLLFLAVFYFGGPVRLLLSANVILYTLHRRHPVIEDKCGNSSQAKRRRRRLSKLFAIESIEHVNHKYVDYQSMGDPRLLEIPHIISIIFIHISHC